jgi:nucleoside-diphosphate-sugar epimerase
MTDGPILVTGAGGFVCSEVAVALTHAGHAVIGHCQKKTG